MLSCLGLAFLLLSLLIVQPQVLSCRVGDQRECDAAPFVPGHNLIGEGFDMVTMQRKGAYVIDMETYLNPNRTCTLCSNQLKGHQLQKLPVSALDWRAFSQTKTYSYGGFHTSVSSLVNDYVSEESHGWKMGLGVRKYASARLDVVGTQSTVYKFASNMMREDRYTFSTQKRMFSHYSYRVSTAPPFSSEFLKDLARLPRYYNSSTSSHYKDFLHTYGTHYIHQVRLGGYVARVTAARTCLSTLNGMSSNDVHSCVSMGIEVGLGNFKLSNVPSPCSKFLQNHGFSTVFSSYIHHHYTVISGGNGWSGEFSLTHNDSLGFKNWQHTLKDHPDVVFFFLRPIHLLIPTKTKRVGIKVTATKYLEDNAMESSPREPECTGNTPNLARNCCPQQVLKGTLRVTSIRAWGLSGDYAGATESYVKMSLGSTYYRTDVINSDYPYWTVDYNFGKVYTLQVLAVEIWDEDLQYDDLLGSCVRYLSQGDNSFTCAAESGRFEVQYTLTCDPYLTGERCGQYKPSP
ncbi:perforin-1-like [Xiphophorus couchianus]|uniref:perforin-1-like n=1 Tax=Xiphophorus couchianus TaxID=32473 RepID=UPI001017041F|nr:perforin-1-like [Xiphophorus couchianus]